MSKEYDKYIAEHKANVTKGYEWMCVKRPLLVPLEGMGNVIEHDISKYSREEYFAYDRYFYGYDKEEEATEDFNHAWLHHIHNNPHHWQYWILFEDDPESGKPFKCLEMPHTYIIEMICDWWAFSWKKGDLYEIFNWYDQHKNIIQLHPHTRKTVEYILSCIKSELDNEKKKGGN